MPSVWRRPGLAAPAFAAYSALALLTTWPVALHPATRVPTVPADVMHISTLLAWGAHVLARPWDLLAVPFFHPFDRSFALSEQLLGASILGLPVWLATHNAVLMYNVVLLLSFPIAATGAYLLVRDVTESRLAGFVAGMVFAFAPYRLSRLMHLHVLLTMWMPYAVAALRRFWRTRGWPPALGLAGALIAQLLSSGHGIAMLAVTLPLVAAILAIREPAALRDPALWRRGLAAGALVLWTAIPFVVPYVALYRDHPEFRRGPREVAFYSSGTYALATAPPGNRLYGGRMDFLPSRDLEWERWLFPGFGVLAVAATGAGVALSRNRPRDVGTGAAVFGLLAVFGAAMSLGMTPSRGGLYGVFYRVVPLMDGIRVPGRFAAITTLGLAGLAGIAVSALRGLGGTGFRWRYVAAGLAVANLLLAEALPATATTYRVPEPSGVYAWLEALTEPGALLELPTRTVLDPPDDGETLREASYLLLLTRHWRPIANGYSSNSPSSYRATIEAVASFPSPAAVAYLRQIGVRFVVVHRGLLAGTPWSNVEETVRSRAPTAIVYDHEAEAVIDVGRLP